MQKKRILQTIIMLFISTMTLSMNVLAEETPLSGDIVSGQCGENANYELDLSTGVLRIYGTGSIEDYGKFVNGVRMYAPWYDYADFITAVRIEEGITSIGAYAFGINPYSSAGVYMNINFVDFANTVTVVGDYAFCYCEGLETVVLPDSVEEIGQGTFQETSISEIKWGEGLASIGESAFSNTALESLELPSSVQRVGKRGFSGCEKLKQAVVPDGCEVFYQAFTYCEALESIRFGESCKLHGELFRYCPMLSDITIGEGSVGAQDPHYGGDDGIFRDCVSLKSIVLPNSWGFRDNNSNTAPYYDQFYGCTQLTDIQFHDDNTKYQTIDKVVYSKDGSTAVYYPEGLADVEYAILSGTKTIGVNAFRYQSYLNYVEIPDTVTSIKFGAFLGSKLKSIIIPDSVAEIEEGAFNNCGDLTQVVLSENIMELALYGKSSIGVFRPCPQTIWGAAGSYAETYANLNGVMFQERLIVYFNDNGGESLGSYKAVLPDEPYRTLPTPTRTGYTFSGWYTSASGGSQVTASTIVNIASSQTLYAHWTEDAAETETPSTETETPSTETPSTETGAPSTSAGTSSGGQQASSATQQSQTNSGANAAPTESGATLSGGTKTEAELATIAQANNKKTVTASKVSMKSASGVTEADRYIALGNIKVGKKSFTLRLNLDGVKNVTYKSSNKKAATINKKGVVKFKGVGKTTITVTATVISTGKKITKKYMLTINPDKTTLKSVKSPSVGRINISWKKNKSGQGYQFSYSSSRNFKKGTKLFNVAKNSITLVSVTDLVPKAKYYVRVRSYKVVSGKIYYGAWSKIKAVKVK